MLNDIRMLVKGIYIKIRKAYQLLSWTREAYAERKKLSFVDTKDSFGDGVKMILIPHVDDEWIGCSQILLSEKNTVLVYTDMEGGDTPEIHLKRKEELRNVSKEMKSPLYTLKQDKILALTDLVINLKPAYVFVPFFIDWHEEHVNVMRLLKDTLKNLSSTQNIKLVCYQVSIPMRADFVTHCKPLDKKLCKFKWKKFAQYYPTQRHIPVDRFALQEHINGSICESFSAEVYSEMECSEWLKKFDEITLSPAKREEAREKLASIAEIRRFINEL